MKIIQIIAVLVPLLSVSFADHYEIAVKDGSLVQLETQGARILTVDDRVSSRDVRRNVSELLAGEQVTINQVESSQIKWFTKSASVKDQMLILNDRIVVIRSGGTATLSIEILAILAIFFAVGLNIDKIAKSFLEEVDGYDDDDRANQCFLIVLVSLCIVALVAVSYNHYSSMIIFFVGFLLGNTIRLIIQRSQRS